MQNVSNVHMLMSAETREYLIESVHTGTKTGEYTTVRYVHKCTKGIRALSAINNVQLSGRIKGEARDRLDCHTVEKFNYSERRVIEC